MQKVLWPRFSLLGGDEDVDCVQKRRRRKQKSKIKINKKKTAAKCWKRMRKKRMLSWFPTVAMHISLCLTVFLFIKMGKKDT